MGVRAWTAAIVVLAALGAVSCGGVTDPSKNRVDTLSGTLNPSENQCLQQTVNVSNGGEYTVKITALQPTPTAVLLVGLWQGAGCVALVNQSYLQLNGTPLAGPFYQKGTYAIQVADPGVLTVPQTFTITVSHP
jgi:hypothetical protein